MLKTLLGISEPELERVHLYARGIVVCELCRPRRRKPPDGSHVVPHTERGQTVRRRVREAA